MRFDWINGYGLPVFIKPALAREMIEGGKVHYNGQRSKPSKIVELNATLTLRQGNDERTVIVKAITEQRRPASEAALLYEETAESVEKRENGDGT